MIRTRTYIQAITNHRMKKTVYTILASALLLTSCGPDKGRELSDMSDPTTADSLLYYYAQLRAHEYWDEAENDTSLRSEEARRQFLDGLRTGMEAIKSSGKDDVYNEGVRLGIRMATNMQNLANLYGLDLDKEVMLESFENGLASQKEFPVTDYQNEFYRLLGVLKKQEIKREKEQSHVTLIEEARKRHMSKIADNLYYAVIRKGSGPYAHNGDALYVSIIYQRADGEDLGMPSPEMVTIGAPGVPFVLNEAYSRLTEGSTIAFATTAEAVFGSRTEIMGLRQSDVIVITITLNDIVSHVHGDDNNEFAHADDSGVPEAADDSI